MQEEEHLAASEANEVHGTLTPYEASRKDSGLDVDWHYAINGAMLGNMPLPEVQKHGKGAARRSCNRAANPSELELQSSAYHASLHGG